MRKIISILFFMTILSPSFAQNLKKDKIKELLTLLHSDSLTIKMVVSMQGSFSTNYLKNLNDSDYLKQISSYIKDSNQLNEIKSMLKDTTFLSTVKANMQNYFGNAKEVGFDKLKEMALKFMNEDMLELYDKYYTLDEIDDLIKFYKTKTGQKVIFIMPELQKEIINTMRTKYSSYFH